MSKLGKFAAACAAVAVGLSAGTLQAAQVAKFVEYIESSGTQWIDTGYFVSPQTKIETDHGTGTLCDYTHPDPAVAKKGDVQFVDPAAGDYRIRPFSTCFNAGLYDATWMDGVTDLGGNPRVKGKRPDIGCYECQDVRGLMMLVR